MQRNDAMQMFINNESQRTHNAHHARVQCIQYNKGFIMTKRNQQRARNQINDATTRNVEFNDNDVVNRDANAIDASMMMQNETTQSNVVVTLKHIIETRKIKCDPKLIRRVLRKYYASKINHQLRDAWTFHESQIDDVVKLIDTHCRAGKSTQNAN